MKTRNLGYGVLRIFIVFCFITLMVTAWKIGEVEGKTVIRLAHHHPIKAYPHKWSLDFKDLVAKKTKGAIEVQIFPAGQLGKERENINGVNMHTVDMTFATPGFLDLYYPGAAITVLPFLYDDYTHAERCFGKEGKAGKLVAEEVLRKSNVRILGYNFAGFRVMFFRDKVVEKLEDFKGLKMRSPENDVWLNMFRLLGAKPTPITWGEVYTSVQTGVVAGMDAGVLGAYENRFYEIAKHMTLTYHMLTFMSPMINKNTYSKLSADLQKVVSDAAEEATMDFNKQSASKNEWALAEMKKAGVQVHNINREPLIKATYPMIEAFIKKTNTKNLYELIIKERKK